MRKLRELFVLVLTLSVSSSALAADVPVLRASLTDSDLAITGVTPGGEAVLVGLSGKTIRGMLTKQQHVEVLPDTDRDGAVRHAPAGGIPFRSLWVAADVGTGAFVIAAPEDFEVDHHELALNEVRKDPEGLITALELERLDVVLLLVRPGEGAWLLQAREGAGGDGDRARNGRLTLVLSDAQPLGDGGNKAPSKLKRGDFLAAFDRGRFELRTLTVTK